MAEIRIENLHKAFGDFVAVKNSNFVVHDGEFLALLGPSGCGKTTTLRMIAGLELPTDGAILLDGENVTFNRARDRDIAFVFQLFALYPHMNVRRNIGFPLLAQGVPSAEIKARVEETARLLQIDHILDKPVSGLAGGDRQRVALGRAIVRRPKCFLMDEPLGTLDAEFRDVMVRELRELHNRIKATTVYVTHDQLEAMAMADKIAIMNKGVVEQFGTPEEVYNRPATLFVADFIGSPGMNFIRFTAPLEAGDASVSIAGAPVAVPLIHESLADGPRVLGVRPEHVRFDPASPLRGKVYETEYLGTTQLVALELLGSIVRARTASDRAFAVGEELGVTFDAKRLSLFDETTGRAVDTALMRERPVVAEPRARKTAHG
jgi:multiple sugar transport system ATP-binding protein